MKRAKIWIIVAVTIWIVEFAAEAIAVAAVWRLNMLPAGLLAALIALFLLVWLLTGWLLLWRDKRPDAKLGYIRRIIAYILAAVVIVGCVAVIFVASKVYQTLHTITDPTEMTSMMAVYVLSDDPAQALEDADGYTFAVTDAFGAEKTQQTVEAIQKELGKDIITVSCDHASDMVDALYAQEAGAMIMDEAYAANLEESEAYADFADRTRILYEVSIVEQTERQDDNDKKDDIEKPTAPNDQEGGDSPVPADITNTPFVFYISGSDTRSQKLTTSLSDVNILAAVNPQTKQILLINTPRDYYVPNPAGNGALDKLTECGMYGIDCSMEALSDLYDAQVEYYAQINFTGFEKLIDAIGGITVYSEYSFRTSDGNYFFQKGDNDLNGSEALAFARERQAFVLGDNIRGKNQMQVIKAVVSKLSTGTIITNYSSILDSLQGMFRTNLSSEDISKLVKMQLSDMAQWNVVSYAVTGESGMETIYSAPKMQVYVMYPDEEMVEYGAQLIDRVFAGEILTDEDMNFPG